MPDFIVSVDLEEEEILEKLSSFTLVTEINRRKLNPKTTEEERKRIHILLGNAMDELFNAGKTDLAMNIDEIRKKYFER